MRLDVIDCGWSVEVCRHPQSCNRVKCFARCGFVQEVEPVADEGDGLEHLDCDLQVVGWCVMGLLRHHG